MPALCKVPAAGATIVMRTRDHCPAHVHAINRSAAWEFKVFFAYAGKDAVHLTFEFVSGRPSIAHVGDVIGEVEARLVRCREQWWESMSDTCLVNQVVTITSMGVLEKAAPLTGFKVKDARYEATRRGIAFHTHVSSIDLFGRCP